MSSFTVLPAIQTTGKRRCARCLDSWSGPCLPCVVRSGTAHDSRRKAQAFRRAAANLPAWF